MEATELFISSLVGAATASVIRTLGLSSGEISQRKAEKVYGSYFKELVKKSRIRPTRVGDGVNGTKWYAVEDILTCQATDAAKATLIFK